MTDGPSSFAEGSFAEGSFAPAAVALRSGLRESLHAGAGVAVDASGRVVATLGDPDLVVYPRSALKPLQAAALVRAGLDVPDEELAIVCASHDGGPSHVDTVRRLLARHGLDVRDLGNTPAWPYGDAPRIDAIRRGAAPSPLFQNCSGKHAGMLATCRVNGWPLVRYLDPEHEIQASITADLAAGRAVVHHVGVDGCGAPTFALSLRALAGAWSELVRRDNGPARAMRAHPELVGGPTRDVTRWMEAVPGLVAKDGAQGVMAVALSDGGAAAFKIADGSDLARRAVVAEALRCLGVDVDGRFASVSAETTVAVLGHGNPVGAVRPVPWNLAAGGS